MRGCLTPKLFRTWRRIAAVKLYTFTEAAPEAIKFPSSCEFEGGSGGGGRYNSIEGNNV